MGHGQLQYRVNSLVSFFLICFQCNKSSMASTQTSNKNISKHKQGNVIQERGTNIGNRPIIDNEEELDLKNVDLTNVNVYRGIGSRTDREAVHCTNFDNIKEAPEVLTTQYRAMLEEIASQDAKMTKSQKTLTTMASNNIRTGVETLLMDLLATRDSDIENGSKVGKFIKVHARARKVQARKDDIFIMEQQLQVTLGFPL
ncbi:hypothetical protein HAX54_027766 [Datura stramonium]|uniref:Uncharacterized protein n=1 Tax=Datura stramonium TaxID=4076 RepID=A0ABS8S913_DATST|nr:hypothetical protein [Datura stramonium]